MMIEEVFSSRGRVKILRILAELGELNISEIARRAGLNYTATNQHLQTLEKAGLVNHKNFGRIRIYRYNETHPLAKTVRAFVEKWEEETRK